MYCDFNVFLSRWVMVFLKDRSWVICCFWSFINDLCDELNKEYQWFCCFVIPLDFKVNDTVFAQFNRMKVYDCILDSFLRFLRYHQRWLKYFYGHLLTSLTLMPSNCCIKLMLKLNWSICFSLVWFRGGLTPFC